MSEGLLKLLKSITNTDDSPTIIAKKIKEYIEKQPVFTTPMNTNPNSKDLIFTPVLQYSEGQSFSGVYNLGERKLILDWWSEGTLFKHLAGLVSYPYAERMDVRKALGLPNNFFIVGDSGGFQRATKGLILDPRRLQKWSDKNDINIQFTLDVPPFKGSTKTKQLSEKINFEDAMKESVDNANTQIEIRQNKRVRLYAVIQGTNLQELDLWFKSITKDHEFDGYAIAPKPQTSVNQIAKVVAWAIDRLKGKPFHILGISGYKTLTTLGILSSLHDKLITMDSISFLEGVLRRTYLLPDLGSGISFGGRKIEDSNIQTLPCYCPICVNTSVDILKDKNNSSKSGMIISLHNLYLIISLLNFIKGLRYEPEIMAKYQQQPYVNEIIQLRNDLEQKGLDPIYHKYFTDHEEETYEDSSLDTWMQ